MEENEDLKGEKAEEERIENEKTDGVSTQPKQDEPKGKKGKRVWYILLAVVIGIACFFGGFFAYRLTLDEELRLLMRLKNKIQKEYYQEITDEAFYDAVFQSVDDCMERGECNSETDFYNAVFDGLNNGLMDEYSEYLTQSEYASMQDASKGKQVGNGAYFLRGTTDLLVYRVAGNSPAERAGLVKGDTIIGAGHTEENIQPFADRSAYSQFVTSVALGETFYLQWQTESGEIRTGALMLKNYVENYIYYKTNELAYGFVKEGDVQVAKSVGEPFTYLNDDTAYIQIVQFTGNASTAFDSAMRLFQKEGKKHLIVDLRGNGGGYLNLMQGISKYFCKNSDKRKPVVVIADYGEKKEEFKASENVYYEYFSDESRIMVLADNLSASASECLIGCMYGYGTISYEDICLVEDSKGVAKTYGKGIMQTTYPIYGGGALKLTTAEIFWPTQTKYGIHGRGVTSADGTKTVSLTATFGAQTRAAIEALYY